MRVYEFGTDEEYLVLTGGTKDKHQFVMDDLDEAIREEIQDQKYSS